MEMCLIQIPFFNGFSKDQFRFTLLVNGNTTNDWGPKHYGLNKPQQTAFLPPFNPFRPEAPFKLPVNRSAHLLLSVVMD